MKRLLVLFGLALALLTVAGCGLFSAPQNVRPDGVVQFEEVQPEQLPADVKSWAMGVTSGKTQPMSEGKTFGDQTYLLVYAGECPTGGYAVKFKRVSAKDGQVTVEAEVVPPAGPASQMVTHPMGVARIARHDGKILFSVAEVRQ